MTQEGDSKSESSRKATDPVNHDSAHSGGDHGQALDNTGEANRSHKNTATVATECKDDQSTAPPMTLAEAAFIFYRGMLWAAWEGLSNGRLPYNTGSIEELRAMDSYAQHCIFLDQVHPHHPVNRKLFEMTLEHFVNVADDGDPWDDRVPLWAEWPEKRDEFIEGLSGSDLRSWALEGAHLTSKTWPNKPIDLKTGQRLIKKQADFYLHRCLKHVTSIKNR